jgi:DNA polymerase-3 subunit epsilon
LYAIVDIETTGGSAANSAITEIAVILHNGKTIEEQFSTLINPQCAIPSYITALTGIHRGMVEDAPLFEDIAATLQQLLKDRIFVAHNVNFDHSFIFHRFKECGIDWQTKKLCTVRYARRVIPTLKSYSLGNLCRTLELPIENRHRAEGDAEATALLFELLLKRDEDLAHLKEMTRGRSPHTYLPMHVPVQSIEQLPYCPGVYYFKDQSGKVVYVGKAVNLKFRVRGHFTNNTAGKRRQEMLRNIFSIDYTPCVTELMALVLESLEIKKLWPLFNRSQKRYEPVYGLYRMEDRAGRLRLVVDKKKGTLPALHTFSSPADAYPLVSRLAAPYGLSADWVFGRFPEDVSLTDEYNQSMHALIADVERYFPTLAIIEAGEDETGRALHVVYLLEKGIFKGMGTGKQRPLHFDDLETIIKPYPSNEFIRNILLDYADRHPESVLLPNG